MAPAAKKSGSPQAFAADWGAAQQLWAPIPVLWVNCLLEAFHSASSEASDRFEVYGDRGHATLPSAIARTRYRPDIFQKLAQ